VTVDFNLRSDSDGKLLIGETRISICVEAPNDRLKDLLMRENTALHEKTLDVLDIKVLVGPIVDLSEQTLSAVVKASNEVSLQLLLLSE
jgi:hypothetical protein